MLKVTAAMLLLGSSVAYAQAPGDYAPSDGPTPDYAQPPPYAQPPAPPAYVPYGAQPVVVAAPVREVNPLAKRFSVALNIGELDIDGGYDTTTSFNVSELVLRYRVSPRLGVEVSFNGGREMGYSYYDDESDLAMGGGTAALSYHFRPDRQWSFYVLAGLGATVVAPRTSSSDEIDSNTRPHAMAGVGSEIRLSPHWALQSELRAYAVGTRDDSDEPIATPGSPNGGLGARFAPDEGYSASQFTVGASFYF